ncbi:MAG: phage replisome organizer N-terminal domain-containing protein [Bacteroidaceae bacterium]|nr:phage replisome organizer N-terminal domain-containing protein [Bacteroidaceae bacterium]
MDVKWIKVSTSMFSGNRKIKQIEVMPEGDTILVIWLKLLLLAGNVNDHGAIYITPEIPYTEEMLANELCRPLTTVRLALSVFEQFGMIEIIDNVYYLSSWEKYQSTDKLAEMREYNREAQRRSRARRKGLCSVNDMSLTSQPCQDTEEEGEEEKDLEFHSFSLADKKTKALEALGGSLGQGVVMISEEQMDDLLEKLSIDEFEKYIKIVAECELKGKRYKKKSHYQAILDMAARDRRIAN